MTSPNAKPDLALIIGPTASGKSALALALAKKQASVIINADSAQVYQDLQVLSARPDETEMDGVPHRLYGYIDGADNCSAPRWASDAKAAISTAYDQGRLPILVGGTGLYIRILLDGIAPIPEIDPEIRADIRALKTSEAHQQLLECDPIAAAKLNPTDTTRIARALEVYRSTGQPLHHWQEQKSGGIANDINLRPLILLPPRDWLYERCDRRFEMMFERGAVEEVEKLLARDLRPDSPVMRAIGVPEIAAYLCGEMDRDTAIASAAQATRRYAKRQFTWFRNQCPVDWPRIEEEISNENISNIEI